MVFSQLPIGQGNFKQTESILMTKVCTLRSPAGTNLTGESGINLIMAYLLKTDGKTSSIQCLFVFFGGSTILAEGE